MDKINILFVCHGNICRSPMAEFVLKQMTGEQFHIESAATSREERCGKMLLFRILEGSTSYRNILLIGMTKVSKW